MSLKNVKDHWAFLDEIEAPMWVDLKLEAKSNYQDVDDWWFHSSHMFHQCPSGQLKAAFTHSGEGSMSLEFDLNGPSSPKLPSSVSRSRGKEYTSKKLRGDDCDLLLNKQHLVKVLNGKPSWVSSGSGDKIKPRLSFITSKGTSTSNSSLVSERGLTGNAKENYLKATSSQWGSETCSSSMADKAGDTSTIASESNQQPQQRNLEVSGQAFGHTSGLLSAMRISLRKSCVTRQASRVEINNDGRQSRDRKSSSSKSSVGSSSNPCYEVKSFTLALTCKKEQTPDSRNVAKMTEAAKKKVKESNVSKASNVQKKEAIGNSRGTGTSNATKSVCQEAAKSKVQNQTLHTKALRPHRLNDQNLVTNGAKAKEKVRMGLPNRLLDGGKENAKGRTPVSQKCISGDVTTGGIARDQKGTKVTKQDVPRKGDRIGLMGAKGKTICPSKGKQPTNEIQRVHLR